MVSCEDTQRVSSGDNRVTVTTVTLENGFAVFAFFQKGFPQLFGKNCFVNGRGKVNEKL